MKLTTFFHTLKTNRYVAKHQDSRIRHRLQALQNRFQGALQFLKKTTITRHHNRLSLDELPWYLLIGPTHAGKTSLLANANIKYILQKQIPKEHLHTMPASEHCDWWVTQEMSIIDVPSNYFNPHTNAWDFFLRLIKQERGKKGINGIIIVLPLPEWMQQSDQKKYHAMLSNLFQHLSHVQRLFPAPIPCQLIITKCDLLPGFSEFFSESTNEDIMQAWGITLPELHAGEKIHHNFTHRFDALIKRLNQQLLWRLHQERNPMARPSIKDFPLQIERLKECIQDFLKKLSGFSNHFSLRSVYLTSSLQIPAETSATILDDAVNASERSIQIFKEPQLSSRAYFINYLMAHGLPSRFHIPSTSEPSSNWKYPASIAASLLLIGSAMGILGHDFRHGMKQTQVIQNKLSQYQLTIEKFNNPNEHLLQTIQLLNELQQSAKKSEFKHNTSHLISFYSDKSQLKANMVYRKALQSFLLPEICNYFQEYLKNPINHNTETVYSTLKSYLMLADTTHLDMDFLFTTLQSLLPNTMDEKTITELHHHLKLTLGINSYSIPLDKNTVEQTRRFLTGLPSLSLSYIILRNLDNNNLDSQLNLGMHIENNAVFSVKPPAKQIPFMFTVKAFNVVFSQEAELAAQEAIMGNSVLGDVANTSKTPEAVSQLAIQLRAAYIRNYIDKWETLLSSIELTPMKDLSQTDSIIMELISDNSPLIQLLKIIRENTYFEPISSTSTKLKNMGALLDKNSEAESLLYQILAGLQSLHQYIQSVLTAENQQKTAFDIMSERAKNIGTPDAITQLRLIALKSPAPIKHWLENIANTSWHFIMQKAGHYLDTSMEEEKPTFTQPRIAKRKATSKRIKKLTVKKLA